MTALPRGPTYSGSKLFDFLANLPVTEVDNPLWPEGRRLRPWSSPVGVGEGERGGKGRFSAQGPGNRVGAQSPARRGQSSKPGGGRSPPQPADNRRGAGACGVEPLSPSAGEVNAPTRSLNGQHPAEHLRWPDRIIAGD